MSLDLSLLAIALTAAIGALIGLAPALVSPILDAAIASWMSGSHQAAMRIGALAPLGTVSALSVSLVALIAALAVLLARRGRALSRAGTWDCGYALPTSRM